MLVSHGTPIPATQRKSNAATPSALVKTGCCTHPRGRKPGKSYSGSDEECGIGYTLTRFNGFYSPTLPYHYPTLPVSGEDVKAVGSGQNGTPMELQTYRDEFRGYTS